MDPLASTQRAASAERPQGTRPLFNRPGGRVYAAAAASLCSAAVLGAVLSLFAQASSDPWLKPTPALLEALAQCRAMPQRVERERCAQATLAQARSNDTADERLAQRGPNAPWR